MTDREPPGKCRWCGAPANRYVVLKYGMVGPKGKRKRVPKVRELVCREHAEKFEDEGATVER